MSWWSGGKDSNGDKVIYKMGRDSKDGSYRAEKNTLHRDGTKSHEVVKTTTSFGGGSKAMSFPTKSNGKK